MGWLLRYTGRKATVVIPGKGPTDVKKGTLLDFPASEARRLTYDVDQPWERVSPSDPDYVAPKDRS